MYRSVFRWLSLLLNLASCDDAPSGPPLGDASPPPVVEVSIEQCEPIGDDAFPSPACADMPAPLTRESTISAESVITVLEGDWTFCFGTMRFITSRLDARGLRLGSDGRWSVLVEMGGLLAPSDQMQEQGSYAVVDESLAFRDQLGDFLGVGSYQLGCGPHQLISLDGAYARGPGRGQGARLQVTPRLDECQQVGTPVQLPADASMAAIALAGRWQACPGALEIGPLFLVDDEQDFGIHLMPNGDWWRLRLIDGAVVRGGHLADIGSWKLEPGEPELGSWWVELGWSFNRFSADGGGYLGGTVVLTENPRQLHWYNHSIETPMVFVSLDP